MKNPNKVDTSKLRKEIRQALFACEMLWTRFGMEFELYHTFDGKHMEGSLHFKNRAFDGSLPTQSEAECIEALRVFLGPEYDVVVEVDHLHAEWDPK